MRLCRLDQNTQGVAVDHARAGARAPGGGSGAARPRRPHPRGRGAGRRYGSSGSSCGRGAARGSPTCARSGAHRGARRRVADPAVAHAREIAIEVVENHHGLLLGLPGRYPDLARGARSSTDTANLIAETDRHPTLTSRRDLTQQRDLRERARRFVDEVLIPNEELAERSGGKIPDELRERIKGESIEAGLSGGLHAREHGGQGWSKLEWFLVEEQFGRSTNALSWHIPGAYNVLASGTRGADRALPRARAARRASRRLRRHRGQRRLGPVADRGRRPSAATAAGRSTARSGS